MRIGELKAQPESYEELPSADPAGAVPAVPGGQSGSEAEASPERRSRPGVRVDACGDGGSGHRTEATNLIKYFGEFPAAEVVNIDRVLIWDAPASLVVKGWDPSPPTCGATGGVSDATLARTTEGRLTFGVEATRGVVGSTDGEWLHDLSDGGCDRAPDVFVLNAWARYRCELEGRKVTVEPYLLVRNLLDRQYACVAGYVMPGLDIVVGFRIEV